MDIKDEIKLAVHEALREHKDDFWINAEQHYQDHQALLKCRQSENDRARRVEFIEDMMALDFEVIKNNHKFVCGVRKVIDDSAADAIKIGRKGILVALLGFTIIAAKGQLIETIKGWMGK